MAGGYKAAWGACRCSGRTTTVPTAGWGFFPLDRHLQVERHWWSEGLRRLVVWLDALVTFEQVESALAEVGQLPMSDTTAWRQVQRAGAKAVAVEMAQRAAASVVPDRQQIVPGEAPQDERLAAATPVPPAEQVRVDGGMVHIRGEGWKELRVGGIGRIELQPGRDPVTGDAVPLAHMVPNSYVAHLGGSQLFGQQLWAEAQARQWSRAADTVVLGDGAAWIWNLRQRLGDAHMPKAQLCPSSALRGSFHQPDLRSSLVAVLRLYWVE